MTARYIVTKAEGVGGPPIPEDEPCIVIRGQDALAPYMLKTYIDLYQQMVGGQQEVWSELNDHYTRLVTWQRYNRHLIKLADR